MKVPDNLRSLLHTLGEKWVVDILFLCEQPMHFNELLHELKPITNHVLSAKLQELQEVGLLEHNNLEYSCTSKCAELCEQLKIVSSLEEK